MCVAVGDGTAKHVAGGVLVFMPGSVAACLLTFERRRYVHILHDACRLSRRVASPAMSRVRGGVNQVFCTSD